MLATLNPSIIPTQTVTHARGSASFSRDFISNQGSVEVVPGVEQPFVSATASVITTKTGNETQFWALRTSIAVFHALSGTFITATNAAYDLPIAERTLPLLHNDETWTASTESSNTSLSSKFKAHIEDASKRGEELAQIWTAALIGETQAEQILRNELATISKNFQQAISQSL